MKKNAKYLIFAVVSIVFGLAYSVSNNIKTYGEMTIDYRFFVASVIAFFALSLINYLLSKNIRVDSRTYNLKKVYLIHFALVLLINILAFLTYFPGVGMNDGLNILRSGMSTSSQFPVFYCAFIVALAKIGYMFGNLNISIALYTISQTLIMSVLIAGVCTWFWSKRIPKWFKYVVSVYLMCEPLIIMYTISMLKDTLFSMLLLVMAILVYEICNSENYQKNIMFWILFAIVCIGIVLIRNNGYYILLPTLFILWFAVPYKKQIAISFAVVIVSVLGTKLAMKIVGTKQLFQEAVAIPLQQMAAVVTEDGEITEEDALFLSGILPLDKIKENYNPYSSDALKWQAEGFNRAFLNENKGAFIKTWMSMLPNNFGIYVKAYLQETFWFWAPIQQEGVQCFFTIETTAGNTWLPEFMETYGIGDRTMLPTVIAKPIKKYLNLATKFFREGICFWIMVFSFVLYGTKTKNKKKCLCYLPLLFLWLTIMIATPISSGTRYVFAFVYAMPLFFSVLFEEG